MYAILGAVLFAAIGIMSIMVALGLPLGEFTMGGQHKILPKRYRIVAIASVLIQVFAIMIILQTGAIIRLWFSLKVTKYICLFFAIYLSLNTIINLTSKSKKERYVMTPLALITSICFWITGLSV